MTSNLKLALGLLAGGLIGAGAAIGIHAQQSKTAPGYVIAEVEANDPEGMKLYGEKVPGTLAPFNHHYVIAGNKVQALEGDAPKGFVVEIAFDSVEKAREWYDSPAYAAIRPIRQKAATSRIFIVEGVPPQ